MTDRNNGFDFDELYNLDEDPHELRNRIDDPAAAAVVQRMFALLWSIARKTGDRGLTSMHYQAMRLAPFGPLTELPAPDGPASKS